ncbi:M15 family metallopeptidase [Nocardioides aurantiacus]|uniref:D-alanyl-D-alanine dipeptidase n=1 Tax=Nocardioides aurantiacus TaxID=86796 RepID=A0A3N2CTN6_9ACTN|nr:M15 family metallopeptidase [Nocardioides aurantiacus]ROR90899.1 D-alanyl-D-alanine dipeptidase [Nocardioides aurantiacus]
MFDASQVVLMGDPRVTGIAVADDGSGLVPAPPAVGLHGRKADPAGVFRLMRRPVADRLGTAAASLPDGIHLCLVEAYRPPERQELYFTTYRDKLRAADPTHDDETLNRLASRFVAPPAFAPHVAGAAVDVTLVDNAGVELDLGCPVDANPEVSGGTCYTHHPGVTGHAGAHRKVLIEAMTAAGFVNYPTEWWHWSHGDRYWAFVTGRDVAVHGPMHSGA